MRTKPRLVISSGGVRPHREDRLVGLAVQIVGPRGAGHGASSTMARRITTRSWKRSGPPPGSCLRSSRDSDAGLRVVTGLSQLALDCVLDLGATGGGPTVRD